MELRIVFKSKEKEPLHVPKQNLHMIQAMLYSLLGKEYGDFLHTQGYRNARNKPMKLFSFSWFQNTRLEFDEKNVIMPDGNFELSVTSPKQEFCNSLIEGIRTQKQCHIGERILDIQKILVTEYLDIEKNPDFPFSVALASPVMCHTTTCLNGKPYYSFLFPEDTEFWTRINHNLKAKYSAMYPGKPIPEGNITCSAKTGLRRVKARFDVRSTVPYKGSWGAFALDGPEEYKKLLLETGLGTKNSAGFGCVVPISGVTFRTRLIPVSEEM